MDISDLCRTIALDLVAGRPAPPMSGVPAQALRHTLRTHGLSGLAARAINATTLVVPEPAAEGIRSDWLAARAWCANLDRECETIGEVALAHSAAGASAPILLKGPAVAGRYADPALRTYTDIDLLVPARDIYLWAESFYSLGYTAPRNHLGTTARRHQESVTFTRSRPPQLSCDLHGCLFLERNARNVNYEVLSYHREPSAFPGLDQLNVAAQLLALSLHFVHHLPVERRLIWVRDILELGSDDVVARTRAQATDHGVRWAVETSLFAAQHVLGRPAWGAKDFPGEGFRQSDNSTSVVSQAVANARELGTLAGSRYLLSRCDPRRFAQPGSFDWQTFGKWLSFAKRTAHTTRWRIRTPRSPGSQRDLATEARKGPDNAT